MIINQYVGELAKGEKGDTLLTKIKEDAIRARLSVENIKVRITDGLVMVSCTGDVANLIRKRKEILRFRCDKIGGEKDKDKDKENG
jgi:hypothetical protein